MNAPRGIRHKSRVPPSALLLALLAAPAAGAELPAVPVSFSADAVMELAGDRMVAKVYHDRGLERQEMSVDGLLQVTILRPDLDTAFVLYPEAETILELPLSELVLLPPPALLEAYQAERLGAERRSGEETTKFRVSVQRASGDSLEYLLWMTADGIAVRMEGSILIDGRAEKVAVQLETIERDQQDPALFDPEAKLVVGDELAENPLYERIGVRGP